jgi:RecB family endonuclease NucS
MGAPSLGDRHVDAGDATSALSRTLPAVRLIVARCEVRYTGRLEALLPMALRLIMVKSDGSVLVHADHGSYKPSNWMTIS